MTYPITIEDIFGRLQSRMSTLSTLSSGIAEWVLSLPDFFSGRDGKNGQSEQKSKTPPYVVKASLSNYELGPMTLMSFFPRQFLPVELAPGQILDQRHKIAVIDYFDYVGKGVHKEKSRDTGGPYEAHVLDMIKGLDLPVDYRIAPILILHDVLERQSKTLLDELQKARREGSDKDIAHLTARVKEERAEFIGDLYGGLVTQINRYSTSQIPNRLSSIEKKTLIADGAFILGAVDWLTRHSEDREFIESAHHLPKWYSVDDYDKTGIGGPFQLKVMDVLGIKEGLEPADYFLARIKGRLYDRISNSRELKRRFTEKQAKELENIVEQDPYLRDMYGKIDFRGDDLPIPYFLNILFRDFVVLHNVNLALINNGRAIVEQEGSNSLSGQYLRRIIKAEEVLLQEINRILSDSIEYYKGKLKAGVRKAVEDEVADTNPVHFKMITGHGPITRLNWIDAERRSKQQYAELDRNPLGIAINYRDFLFFRKLYEQFTDPSANTIDLHRGQFSLFTIDGVTDRLIVDSSLIGSYNTRTAK